MQRVAIARALINDPLLILADEPTGNLDTRSSREIMGLLVQLHERGRTILMVTHEKDIAAYAERVIRFQDGHIIADEQNGSLRKLAIEQEGHDEPA
jgi:ABC-type lipoprotein export system ATPase subunit